MLLIVFTFWELLKTPKSRLAMEAYIPLLPSKGEEERSLLEVNAHFADGA